MEKKSPNSLAWYRRSSITWPLCFLQPYLPLFPNTSPLLESGLSIPSEIQTHYLKKKKKKKVLKKTQTYKKVKKNKIINHIYFLPQLPAHVIPFN